MSNQSNFINRSNVLQKTSTEEMLSASSGECKFCRSGAMEMMSMPAMLA